MDTPGWIVQARISLVCGVIMHEFNFKLWWLVVIEPGMNTQVALTVNFCILPEGKGKIVKISFIFGAVFIIVAFPLKSLLKFSAMIG